MPFMRAVVFPIEVAASVWAYGPRTWNRSTRPVLVSVPFVATTWYQTTSLSLNCTVFETAWADEELIDVDGEVTLQLLMRPLLVLGADEDVL